jgi:hypothetical protein
MASEDAAAARWPTADAVSGERAAALAQQSAAAAAMVAGADAGPRGLKRAQRECSGEPELSTRQLNRLEGNALRLRGLLRNAVATPDKRRFSLDLQSQIDTLERTVATGKEEQDVQHSDVRARLDGLSL